MLRAPHSLNVLAGGLLSLLPCASFAADQQLPEPVAVPADAAAPDTGVTETPSAADTLPAAASVAPPPPARKGPPEGFGFTGRFFAEAGGDDVAWVIFTDGSSDTITAGDGFGLGLGVHFRPKDSRVDFVGMWSYKLAQVVATNASIEVSRSALELRGDYFFTDNVWGSLGVVQHSGIRYDGDGLTPNLAFDDANGESFRLGYGPVALVHTRIEYVDEFGFLYDATSTGLEVIARW